MLQHPFLPLYDKNSKVLILGSFPSVKSREQGFYYGHPGNRFWKVISGILGEDIPNTIEEKKSLILRNHLALWDVVAECEITGSQDAGIKNARANDIRGILEKSLVRKIIANGRTAEKLYKKHVEPATGIAAVALPSTSPANAAWTLDKLLEVWGNQIVL